MATVIVSLNPYCSGRWSRTAAAKSDKGLQFSLNPYCSGQWSRTQFFEFGTRNLIES